MFKILKSTIEYQNWGWSSTTISSAGTILFTFVEGWGLWSQNTTIWENKSGESISVYWMSALMFALFAFGIYGLYIHSIAIAFNGFTLGVLHVPILLGLKKFKGFSRKEELVFWIASLMIPAMIISPAKDLVFIVVYFTATAAFSLEPWEIWKEKNAGVVDTKMIGAYLASTTFWLVYAYSIGDWVMEIGTPVILIMLLIAVALWLYYPSQRETKA